MDHDCIACGIACDCGEDAEWCERCTFCTGLDDNYDDYGYSDDDDDDLDTDDDWGIFSGSDDGSDENDD